MSFNNTKTPRKPTGKAKYQLPMRPGKSGTKEFYLEGELKDKFCKLFPIHSNRRIMQWFGISHSTCQRFKKELGLQKNMDAIRREQARDTKKTCEENGYYASKRGKRLPEACYEASRKKYKEGYHPLKVMKENEPRRYKRFVKKQREYRIELERKERRRIALGLTPTTNIPLNHLGACRLYSRQEVHYRYYARRYGYITGDPVTERYILYYDNETDRRAIFERNITKKGFEILPLPKEKTNLSVMRYSNNEPLKAVML
ncbi:MAG: hypothetical protein KBT34_05510 [Prevotella sp.]|nr:hypothetical protein [Candidatus Prevotella equi]